MTPKIKITVEITADGANGAKAETSFSIETEAGKSWLCNEFMKMFDKASSEFVKKNKPGTSRKNPVLVKSWNEVKSTNVYYALETKPEWWIQIDEMKEYGETIYSLTCMSRSDPFGHFFPMESANFVKTWKTIGGVVRYIENQLKAYWS